LDLSIKVDIKFFTASEYEKRKGKRRAKIVFPGIKTVAITAIDDILICHEFETEADALKVMPFIKRWDRVTWDKRHIRYHSLAAERYWRSRSINDRIKSTRVIYTATGKKYIYDHG
jgi:hypothetical protein